MFLRFLNINKTYYFCFTIKNYFVFVVNKECNNMEFLFPIKQKTLFFYFQIKHDYVL
jgi:hypothetical protein